MSPDLHGLLRRHGQSVGFHAGDALFAPGRACEGFIVIEAGRVKVMATAESGRQMVLYRLGPGESCIVTTACLLAHTRYDAEAMAETDGRALVVPRAAFEQLLDASKPFRSLVFGGFAQRLSALVQVVQGVMDRRLDCRLARFLADAAPELHATQQQIAENLGTAREVVSRLLKDFEARGWVNTARGHIHITQPDQLARFAMAM